MVLQEGVVGLAMRLWINDHWVPAIGAVAQQPAPAAANVPTGLEVAMQMGSQDTALIKVFLLGAI